MYRFLIHEYLHSDAYRESEHNEIYLQLIQLLTEQLAEASFLEYEELLHEVMLCRIEDAFLAGYKKAYQQWQHIKTGTV